MQEVIYIPPFQTPEKALRGSPCNGCGWCCHEEICKIGTTLLKIYDEDGMTPHFVEGPCPLMDFVDGKVRCGAIRMENEAIAEGKPLPGKTFAEMLGVDKGCCADDPTTEAKHG
jgi:hypothetical protein